MAVGSLTRRCQVDMERVFCWRCGRFVVAYDEDTFAAVARLHLEGVKRIKAYREKHGCSLAETPVAELHRPLYQAHEQRTGENNVHHDEIVKHRLREFGPPCPNCGRNFRTPAASKCFECGTRRTT